MGGAFLATFMIALPSAPAMAQGDRYWQVRIAGQVMHCTSWDGMRAVIQYSRRLNDVGHASRLANGQPLVQINPGVVAWVSPVVGQWWFAHECAHHALPPRQNSEEAADCFATRQMVASGVTTLVSGLGAPSTIALPRMLTNAKNRRRNCRGRNA